MLDKTYFETLLSEQFRWFGGRVRVEVALHDGTVIEPWALFAAHDHYVILEVYPAGGKPPLQRSDWDGEASTAGKPPWIFDQLCIPYGNIAHVRVIPTTEEATATTPIGFKVNPDRSVSAS